MQPDPDEPKPSNLRELGKEIDQSSPSKYFISISILLLACNVVAYIYAPVIVRSIMIPTLMIMSFCVLLFMVPQIKHGKKTFQLVLVLFYETVIVGLGISLALISKGTTVTALMVLGSGLYLGAVALLLAFSHFGRLANIALTIQIVGIGAWAMWGNAEMHPWIVPWMSIMLAVSIYAAVNNDNLANSVYHVYLAQKNAYDLRVQNERLRTLAIEKEIELARQVQDALVTQFDPFDWRGFRVEYYQKKFDALGGDWFATRVLDSGDLVLAVTDVSGKGLAAAMVAQAIHTLWVETLFEADFSPELFMQNANKTLLTMGARVPHTATMGIALISEKGVRYYSAGHVPLVLDFGSSAVKRFLPVVASGNILGMAPTLSLSVKQVSISAASLEGFMLGTDGVFDGGTSHRQKGLVELLTKLEAGSTEALGHFGPSDDKLLIWARRTVPKRIAA